MEDIICITDKDFFYGLIPVEIEISKKDAKEIIEQFPLPKFPEEKITVDIKEYNDGEEIENLLVIVNEVEIKKAKNDQPFLNATFSNAKGTFNGKMFDRNGSTYTAKKFFEKNKVLNISGKANEFPKNSGIKSIMITNYELPSEKINPFSLLPTSNEHIGAMILEMVTYINKLKEPHKTVALSGMKKYWRDFRIKPAGKSHHHAFLGGLLQHTLENIRIADFITKDEKNPLVEMSKLISHANHMHLEEIIEETKKDQPKRYHQFKWSNMIETLQNHLYGLGLSMKEYKFDKDLLISAIIWHDFGKIYEYTHLGDHNKYRYLFPFANDIDEFDEIMESKTSGIEMDSLGKLLGHIPIGMMMFQNECFQMNLDLQTIFKYQHAIVAHHGKKDWGSPITPATPEAYLLTMIDSLDARYMTMN